MTNICREQNSTNQRQNVKKISKDMTNICRELNSTNERQSQLYLDELTADVS